MIESPRAAMLARHRTAEHLEQLWRSVEEANEFLLDLPHTMTILDLLD